MRPVRLALYGDVDLNILDGSAIWLASLAEVLSRNPRVQLTVLLKNDESRDLITGPLRSLDRVELVRPPDRTGRLTQQQAVAELERRDREQRFDAIVLRGFRVSLVAAGSALAGRLWTYLTDIPQRAGDVTDDARDDLTTIAEASDRMLTQTEELRAYLEGVVPAARGRTMELPPMVPPDFVAQPHDPPSGRGLRLFYAGKFAPLWGFLEVVDAFRSLREQHPELEFHVAGDKIHDPPDDPTFAPAVRRALAETEGLVWHGAVSREEVGRLLGEVDLALSARHRDLSESLELSTKLLEYGAAGVPVLMNRTAMHERLYGRDYPLFIDGLDDVEQALAVAIEDTEAWRAARDRTAAVAERYTYDAIAERLVRHLDRLAPPVGVTTGRRPRILVAGHDLKFFTAFQRHLERAGADLRVDLWSGHRSHDAEASRDALRWADTVVCEWALGNSVWYAEHRRDDQRLVVRFHRQELETEFPPRLRIDAVDRMVFVSDRIRREAVERYGWDHDRLTVIPNAVDTLSLDRPKLDGARHNLALVGYLPRLKGLRRALDLLVELRRHDPRYRLHLAGSLPWNVGWVWNRASERNYFSQELDRIRRHRLLGDAVSVRGHVNPVASWLPAVGVILSMSDLESFHLGLAEGMASRALPVIRDWVGADELYPGRFVHGSIDAMAEHLLDLDDEEWVGAGEDARAHIVRHYDLDQLARRWTELVLA